MFDVCAKKKRKCKIQYVHKAKKLWAQTKIFCLTKKIFHLKSKYAFPFLSGVLKLDVDYVVLVCSVFPILV